MSKQFGHNQPHGRAEHASLGLEEAFILGFNVERLRCAANMDIAMFARVAGISRPTVYKIEDGESDLKLSMLKKVASALDVEIVDLLTPPCYDTDGDYCERTCRKRAAIRRENRPQRKPGDAR